MDEVNVSTGPASRSGELAGFDASLADAIAGQPILCFANDWTGDPTSKHHVMRTLARHTDVTWVESSGMRLPRWTNPGDLRRIIRKVVRSTRRQDGDVGTPDRLKVVSPLAVPVPGSRLAEAANRRIYARAIARAAEDRPPERPLPLHWVYTPTVEPYLDAIPGAGLVYHCVDRWWEFSEYNEDVMRRHHLYLCMRADVVFASSAHLIEDCEPFSDNVHLVRHGVEWEHFSRAALDELRVPEELRDIDGPVVGFFGLIHDWIDQSKIGAVADALPDCTVVLLGNARVDTSALAARPNVRLLGQKPYAELPAYAARFDVGLVPFVINELTEAVNPIKLREYLSAGLPVVSTPLPEMTVYKDHTRVWIADGEEAFVAAVREAVAGSGGAEDRATAAAAMISESWVGRTAEMVRLWRETR